MKKKTYLSDFYSEIPSNCVLNKVATGCGGTSLEIENMNRDSIITVPLEQMINNKVKQYPNERTPAEFKMFGVKAGVTVDDIVEYLKTNKIHKIITTYDSQDKVIRAIHEYGKRMLSTYFLLVDEVHYIMNNYVLRKDAITRLLNTYTLFENWCFLTATPNEPEFMLEELKDIPLEVAPFKLEKIMVENVKTIQVRATTKKIILEFLNNRLQNAHIFCNSLQIIGSLIKDCNLDNTNCRAVWSKSNKKHKHTIQGISRSEVGGEVKKINLYTSTSFEGSDIYDREGQYIIVSDGTIAHTLNDISTSFRQILGRIRNTKYRGYATHVFKATRYSQFTTFEEYKARTLRLQSEAGQLINTLNTFSEMTFTDSELNDKYITQIDGVYTLDKNLITYDLMKYKLSTQTYGTVSVVNEEQEKSGFDSYITLDWVEPSDLIKRSRKAKIKFADAFEEYAKIKNETTPGKINQFAYMGESDRERLDMLEEVYPIIKKAYDELGIKEIRRLNYHQTNIKKKIIAESDRPHKNKIFRILCQDGFSRNNWISRADCKIRIQNAYRLVGVGKTAKATDIDNYFEADEKTKRIEVGGTVKPVRGFQIIRDKFTFN